MAPREARVEGRRLVHDPDEPSGFRYAGNEIPFDSVYTISANQRLADLDPATGPGRKASQFAFALTKLLRALQRTFDGDPTHFEHAMGVMFELKPAGQALVATNTGPTFEWVEVNR